MSISFAGRLELELVCSRRSLGTSHQGHPGRKVGAGVVQARDSHGTPCQGGSGGMVGSGA